MASVAATGRPSRIVPRRTRTLYLVRIGLRRLALRAWQNENQLISPTNVRCVRPTNLPLAQVLSGYTDAFLMRRVCAMSGDPPIEVVGLELVVAPSSAQFAATCRVK
ncbi:hypothetical protein PUNSTDRAFT_52630 [Punctularia strigosozonata HHB-11173 SS5]|uniref:uncharacterized protein n=1 Tax=Punctularia strigosozonata (strain HHB-11173) TaxID=741275 RepID=UPI00044171A3|nr:uncharacterized protein PUNSTDRAFT_52630 [Punctularia strigosozonata HHB-11173 SS5]EIN08141.1 hypothetical protein PUNSTDRAFT_52630 [Punctularia strigosozonata HHB-11173 SS5]